MLSSRWLTRRLARFAAGRRATAAATSALSAQGGVAIAPSLVSPCAVGARATTCHVFAAPQRCLSSVSAAPGVVNNGSDSELRRQLLDAALVHVGDKGWTKDALAAGARDLGLSPSAHGIIDRGAVELVYHWMDRGNLELRDLLEDITRPEGPHSVGGMTGEQVVLRGLKHRLQFTIPVVWNWPEAMALGAQPANVADTLARLSEVSHLVCQFADKCSDGAITNGSNDTATTRSRSGGSNWFVRRSAVGAVYVAAELHMLTDYSEHFEDTWAFLARRLADSESIAQHSSGIFGVLNAFGAGAGSLASGLQSVTQANNNSGAMGPSNRFDLPSFIPTPPQPEEVKRAAMRMRQVTLDLAQQSGNQSLVHALRTLDQHVNPFGGPDVSPPRRKEQQTQQQEEEETFEGGGGDGDSVVRVNLPNGLSLFGLLSMDVAKAAALVRDHNPDFEVIEWPAEDNFDAIDSARLVRLLFNDNGVVVDVSRG